MAQSDQNSMASIASSSTLEDGQEVQRTGNDVIKKNSFLGRLLIPTIVLFFGFILIYSSYLSIVYPIMIALRTRNLGSSLFQVKWDYVNRPRYISGLTQMAVAADNGNCSEIGYNILLKNGNAADAAIAATICQGILNNFFSGFGGGAFINIWSPGQGAEIIDSREYASSQAYTHMYDGKSDASKRGGLAIGIPMELKGLQVLHDRHGKLPWSELIEPSIHFARDGFPAHPELSKLITRSDYPKEVPLKVTDAIAKQFFVKSENGTLRPPMPGDWCCQNTNLTNLLEKVAKDGAKALYNQETVETIAQEINSQGGNVTSDDFFYQGPIIRQPITDTVFGYEFIVPPPPSGAVLMLTALKILEKLMEKDNQQKSIKSDNYNLDSRKIGFNSGSKLSSYDEDLWTHRLVETVKHVFAIRQHLGDPGLSQEFLNLDQILFDILSEPYIANLTSSINDSSTLHDTWLYGGKYNLTADEIFTDGGTSHLNAVDKDGMCVAITTTLNGPFGSQVFSKSTGILFNNQMDDFAKPGQRDLFNTTPSVYNKIIPYRKPLSSMSPTVVLRDGKPVLVTGSSGGTTIITVLLELFWKHLVLGKNLPETVFKARLHHQLIPDVVILENIHFEEVNLQVKQELIDSLIQKNHKMYQFYSIGNSQAIRFNYHTNGSFKSLDAISDLRKDGAPYGL